jgi:hypothetical protein
MDWNRVATVVAFFLPPAPGLADRFCAYCYGNIFRANICVSRVYFASDAMTVSDEYRVKAAEFRAKADSQRDPLFRSMFETLSKTYSRLARHHERDYRPKLAFRPSPPIAIVDPPKQKRRRAKKPGIEAGT